MARGTAIMVILSCAFWAFVVYILELRAYNTGIPENISRISVPPRRERLLIRLHSHHVNATLTRTAGRKGLRSIHTQMHVKQRQDYIIHEGGSQAYAQLIQELRLPGPFSAQDASAAKAKLERTAGSRSIYIAKDIPSSLLQKLGPGLKGISDHAEDPAASMQQSQ